MKEQRFLQALLNGEELTEAQARSRFGLQNVRAAACHLRQNHGYAVYGNKRIDSRGQSVTKYRLGTPSREVVAAGFRALSRA